MILLLLILLLAQPPLLLAQGLFSGNTNFIAYCKKDIFKRKVYEMRSSDEVFIRFIVTGNSNSKNQCCGASSFSYGSDPTILYS
jgi:hypothetical protein